MKLIGAVIIALLSLPVQSGTVDCPDLTWRLVKEGLPGVYRGHVKPGAVDVIYLELYNNSGVIGDGMGFPNPGGNWEITIYSDYHVKKRHREVFYCEQY